VVSYSLCNWGFSSIGIYTEFLSLVEVKYKGVKYDYLLECILDNEAAIFVGREKWGS
jgi:acetoacetate decarboxylase